ncbi:MAG: glucoamylase family protein [Chryseolinea sp.]
MRGKVNAIDEILSPLLNHFQKESLARQEANEKPPLRSELFSTEQMEQHAQQLAANHQLSKTDAPELLLKRLAENEEILFDVTNMLHDAVREKKAITPAGEWLLDNFYLIEEQIAIGKRYLPKGYSKGLPRLSSGSAAGFPRVYDIAIQIISHSDGRVDLHTLNSFINSYQKVNFLTIGELWAIPIMLRLALLENLSRVAARIAIDSKDADLATEWSDRVIKTAEENPKDLVLVIADMARSNPPMVSAFVAEFSRKLQWKGLDLNLPLTWVEQHLAESSSSINLMVLIENQKQAADQLSMSNSINSLRFLAKMDWREFVETISVVEQLLRADIDGIYGQMDFYTRDHYRHAIEKVAKCSKSSEHEVASIAIAQALKAAEKDPSDKRRSHVGYYLVGPGSSITEKLANVKYTGAQRLQKFFYKNIRSFYGLLAFVLTVIIGIGLVVEVRPDVESPKLLIIIGVLSLFAASHFAIALANWWATLSVGPKPLPKLDFSTGIPSTYRTLVTVPSIIANKVQAQQLVDELEVRFLANRDPNIFFSLLTDFGDAISETLPQDDDVVQVAQQGISALNKRYGRLAQDRFFLLHRPRRWNAQEKKWMGYERKRGKLTELNHVLRGTGTDRFSLISGDQAIFTTIKYVITLDTDTQIPRDAAHRLIGLMAHPLNQPYYNPDKKRVTDGYGIIQPRIAISLHGAKFTRYTRMHENDSGIDPYTRITSDVYQDVFEEGSFIGKGIYDVDAFEQSLHDRFPENRILSHDLLEGSYARCGYASDVQLYEEYPSKYSMDVSRRHRWIRGDWQIGNWFLPLVPEGDKRLHKNPISGLSKWKIFDNLRRSLVPVALFLLITIAWIFLSDVWFWTMCLTAIIVLQPMLMSAWHAFSKPPEIAGAQHISNALTSAYKNIQQAFFTLVCLPYEAFYSTDAILRTLWRMYISRKKLLQWNPSGLIKSGDESLVATYGKMWFPPVASLGIAIYLLNYRPENLLLAIPVLTVWLFSPVWIWWMSKPLPSSKSQIDATQRIYLRELARKTWAFFEDLVGVEDNWLPPDNLQQYPIPVVAHRTSPTNIGLSLLANLTAVDFGFSTVSTLIHRTSKTFETMEKLDRFQGHFYNWYDTQTLKTLNPKYISTVDSGNLAGHLLTLRQGLLGMLQAPVIPENYVPGLYDTLKIAKAQSKTTDPGLAKFIKDFEERRLLYPYRLKDLKDFLEAIRQDFSTFLHTSGTDHKDIATWTKAFERQISQAQDEIRKFAPWLALPTAPEKFKDFAITHNIPTLAQLTSIDKTHSPAVETYLASGDLTASEQEWLHDLMSKLQQASMRARERLALLQSLADECTEFADMEYSFLYDKSQHLLAIGFNVDSHVRDASFYDLLASEARLSAFVAIAQGKLPQESWFALGRRLTTADNTPVLLSWSGSMFEYLMPLLVMPTYENTLLDETYKGTVKKQIEYGRQQNVPWGISESCYNIVDSSLTYQYRAFGVPGLGFKRGLGLDLVIAPYATVLGLMVDPKASSENLERLRDAGYEGKYGFYESIDFTPARLPRGQSPVVIQTFMAHHQGMSLLSIAYLLLDKPMQKRFEADVQFQTALLLLQEQIPKTTGFYSASTEMEDITPVSSHSQMRVIHTPDTPTPEVQLLSNGRYHVMITNAGGGYSRWKELAVTRWREDSTCDYWGAFCYIRDLETKVFWSNTHQPTLTESENYTAVFSQGRAEFRRKDQEIETYTEIIVSPEDDVEIRRIHLTNRSRTKRHIELTSYGEAVLAPHMADALHPAFSNLFVQTEINANQHAVLCTRRARSKDERPPWMFHLMKVSSNNEQAVTFETDRYKFIGRGRSLADPVVMTMQEPLSGAQGSVLDPIVSVQYRLIIDARETVIVDIITGMSGNREETQYLVDKYQDRHLRDRAFELSWTHSQVVLRQINSTEEDAELYARLASAVLYTNPSLRANPSILIKNQRGQSALWGHSISGDLPIVLLEVSDSGNISLVKQLIQAQAYWHLKGLAVDLVILNQDPSGYRQLLQDQIQGLIAAGIGINSADKQGRIFVRPVEQVSAEDLILLKAVAKVIISDSRGTLADQINRRIATKAGIPNLVPSQNYAPLKEKTIAPPALQFYNGVGGFSQDGKEYVIHNEGSKRTPLPWINVIANPSFGTIVTESGPSYTWSENAHSFRLTPWNNDPITDRNGEAYYVRDEESGAFWSPMPLPTRSNSLYTTRHGFGYTVFEHVRDGIHTQATIFVDLHSPIKFVVVKIRNSSARTRKLSVTGYAEWVLADLRTRSSQHIVTELDTSTGALIAKNAYNTEFANRVAFFDVDDPQYDFTSDRTEFIGRNGNLQAPDAMLKTKLSGKSGAGFDPCTAMRVPIELEADASREIIFRMGAGKDRFETIDIIKKFRGSKAAATVLHNVKQYWDHTLGSIQIETPDASLNTLSNGWLQYQVMACRLWGRSGYYQSGGAFGFRDQLQDVLALMHSEPAITRAQILLAASRQFQEGDVQHWWHPPAGRGVRTLCSDDYVWLPFVTSQYIITTGDTKILQEIVPFLEGRQLNNMEESYYDLPVISEKRATLYDHCKRAIQHGLRFGKNGLPFIGSGDWNDGMNMVGIHGQGESVWLAFFLYDVLKKFAPIAERADDKVFSQHCEASAALLKENINTNAWDGDWYRRAYFDDGTPLGSAANEECKIDSISQSWSVISGAGLPERTKSAMLSVDKFLINRDKGLLQLLEPPFNNAAMDPGYIKGYVPGVRENGGQYTHAAVWMVMAFAKLGDRFHTWELLNMINPINHGKTAADVATYKVEPYVMAADVYGVHPHTGRGGWTWYTGSAGWMYQLILSSFLGIRREGSKLWFEPCVPADWETFSVKYRHQSSWYNIRLTQIAEATENLKIIVDDVTQSQPFILLEDDEKTREVTILWKMKDAPKELAIQTKETSV